MEHDERRKNTRVSFHTTASLKFPEMSFDKCETRDLSIKDVFVLGVQGVEVEDECEVILHLSGMTSDLNLTMRGKVVRVQGDGVAICFFEIDLDSFYHLKNIVYYNTENPDEVADVVDDEGVGGVFVDH